ncbi:MAG: YkgJ family cysteine cluster protein [Desulfobacterales bacterium]|nr:YkgJ family cysteine cluster protein [Desulfobacterales bacterium]
MDLNSKLAVLEKIYRIYGDFAATLDIVCRRYCSLCCTVNVTITTLEGFKIAESLMPEEKRYLFEKIRRASSTQRFRPRETVNMLAELSREEGVVPEEDNAFPGECPLLIANECSVYNERPFGCRCFVSKQNCAESGSATVDDFVLTVNNIFLQVIEHVDAGGFSGNLTDVLLFLENAENLLSSKMINPSSVLIKNHPLKILMIPPEHRGKAQPILGALNKLKY